MGAWSHEPFGNDTACDWTYELEESGDCAFIEATLDKILATGDEYLESPDAEEAVAAAEVLAKLCGGGTQDDAYTEEIDAWVSRIAIQPGPALLQKARQALQRILGEGSELAELWEEAGNGTEWRNSVERIRLALGAEAP